MRKGRRQKAEGRRQKADRNTQFRCSTAYQPLLESVNAIEQQLLDNQQRGKLAPPPPAKPEHSAEIFNIFTLVTSAADIRKAAQAAMDKIAKTSTVTKGLGD